MSDLVFFKVFLFFSLEISESIFHFFLAWTDLEVFENKVCFFPTTQSRYSRICPQTKTYMRVLFFKTDLVQLSRTWCSLVLFGVKMVHIKTFLY